MSTEQQTDQRRGGLPSLVDRREVEKLLVIAGALRSGIIDALADAGGTGRTAEDVAAAVGGDERACFLVLESLGTIDLVEKEGKAYRLTEAARVHLVEPGPEMERHSLLHQVDKFRGWLDLAYVVEHGRPPVRDTGPRDVRNFVLTMAEGDPEVMDEVVDRILEYADPLPDESAVDIGGAVGHMAVRFARRGLRAVLVDRQEVLEVAPEHLGDEADLVQREAADFNETLPPGPFGAAYLGNVYHIYGPDSNRELTRRVYDVLVPGGTIAIRDFVWERSPRASMFAINMLQATNDGGVWEEEQYRSWLSEAGFSQIKVLDLEKSPNQLVLAKKPRSLTERVRQTMSRGIGQLLGPNGNRHASERKE